MPITQAESGCAKHSLPGNASALQLLTSLKCQQLQHSVKAGGATQSWTWDGEHGRLVGPRSVKA